MKREYLPYAAAAGFLLIVFLGWMAMSRPEDPGYSTSGFDLRGAAAMAARAAGAPSPIPRRPASSLTLPGQNVDSGMVPAVPPSAFSTTSQLAAAPTPSAENTAAQAASQEGPVGQAAVADPEQESEIKAATPQEASRFGATAEALAQGFKNLSWKITEHPKVLKFVLDSTVLNKVVFATPFAKKMCNDGAYAKAYFSDGVTKGSMEAQMEDVRWLLRKPESAKAAAESLFAKNILACSSWDQVTSNGQNVVDIAKANPATLPFLGDPTAVELIGGNPRAQQIMQRIETSLNSTPLPAR